MSFRKWRPFCLGLSVLNELSNKDKHLSYWKCFKGSHQISWDLKKSRQPHWLVWSHQKNKFIIMNSTSNFRKCMARFAISIVFAHGFPFETFPVCLMVIFWEYSGNNGKCWENVSSPRTDTGTTIVWSFPREISVSVWSDSVGNILGNIWILGNTGTCEDLSSYCLLLLGQIQT